MADMGSLAMNQPCRLRVHPKSSPPNGDIGRPALTILEGLDCPLRAGDGKVSAWIKTSAYDSMYESINKSESAIFADAVVPADLVRYSPLILVAILYRKNIMRARMAYRHWVIGPFVAIQNIICGPYARLFWLFRLNDALASTNA